jgi:hypothetical protein
LVRSISEDWDIHASADVRNLFFDPKAPKAVVRDAYLVQQGNIYVTQVGVTHSTLVETDISANGSADASSVQG